MKPQRPLATLRELPLLEGVLATCLVWGLLYSFVWLEHERRLQAERAVLQAEAGTVRARLESELNATLSLSLGLSTFVLAKPDFSEADLKQVAASLIRLQPAIRSVARAPGSNSTPSLDTLMQKADEAIRTARLKLAVCFLPVFRT